jgi:hypothetical protein
MKYRIKIPKDGDLKWDDVMTCEHLSVTKSLDGKTVEGEDNGVWITADCYGLKRRIPKNWIEEVAPVTHGFLECVDRLTSHDITKIEWYAVYFTLSDMKRVWESCKKFYNVEEK